MSTLCRASGTWVMVLLLQWCFSERSEVVEASHVIYKQPQSISSSTTLDTKLKPKYHFQPIKNWINDPNGPMYYNGMYHLFYQYNPKGAVWANIVWAHSVSKDLINWISLNPAIYPSEPFDVNGCWSGSTTILPGNKPAILYTGIDSRNDQVQNIALPKNLSDPYLRDWVKPDYNPLIVPVLGINASEFRDPTTAWYGADKHWRVIVGSLWVKRGLAIMYRSKDFRYWIKAKHPLHSVKGAGMWECPDFFPVAVEGKDGLDGSAYGGGTRHVLKVSLDWKRIEYYTLGVYDCTVDRYLPDSTAVDDHTGLRYDYGNFYASKTFYDPSKRRRILWGWVNESDGAPADRVKGWAGVQTIPRTIWLDASGRQLVQWPIEELESLRGGQVSIHHEIVRSEDCFEVKGLQTVQADVEVTFEVSSLARAEAFDPAWRSDAQALCGTKGADAKGGVGPFGLMVLASAQMEERTAVFFRVFKDEDKYMVLMCHDPTRSSLGPNLDRPTFAGFVDIDITKTRKISMRSLIDHSVVESFGAEGKTCITSRVYPSLAIGEDVHLFVFNNGVEDVKVIQLSAWEMRTPIMNEARRGE